MEVVIKIISLFSKNKQQSLKITVVRTLYEAWRMNECV